MNSEENTMTVESVLTEVHRILSGIKPPMAEFDEISVPINQALSGIRACIVAIREANEKAANEAAEKEAAEKMGDVDFGTAEEPAGEPEGEADA